MTQIKAILGPTNTGKTYTALERLLAYPSGIIGFPLRLLAKENYDRMVEIKGKKNVGLITGEEKIVPPQAKWFSCTVEAMPVHIPVDIVIIDEIQLCSDPDRGHIFTHRLLHCRGTYETIFLGADTIIPILKKLVPSIEIQTRPRLSSLVYNGFTKLTKLPPRCAIVAFSAHEVYAIAELVKRQKGGCAIIMGRLSPRTRNAQMELYQNKEVDYLIATDAIGMGLNMDVNHIAFVNLSKYDGRQMRNLYPSEIAQIAGRAGRGSRDGTFGITANCPIISDKIVNAIENHAFDPIKQIYWRNHDLDFQNPLTLFSTLTTPSLFPQLITGQYSSDLKNLSYLIQDHEVRSICTSQFKTELLWECCQIPDFKKIGSEYHARICKQIFLFLIKQGHIPENWIDQQIQQLNHLQGDIDTLMQRLASIRIYSFLTTKNNWVESSSYWHAQTKEIEEKLSDALHDSLVSKFVNQRVTNLIHHLSHSKQINAFTSITNEGNISIDGEFIGKIRGFCFQLPDSIQKEERSFILKKINKSIEKFIHQQVNRLIHDNDKEFTIDHDKKIISWQKSPIAQLKKGKDFFHPDICLLNKDLIQQVFQNLILRRLKEFLENYNRRLFPNFFNALDNDNNTPELRGILHQLYENGGILWTEQYFSLSKDTIKQLKHYKIHYGNHAIYIENLFKEKQYYLRHTLLTLNEQIANPVLLSPKQVAYLTSSTMNKNLVAKMGWLVANKQIIRLDIAEKLTFKLKKASKKHPVCFHKKWIAPVPYYNDNIIPLLKSLKLQPKKPEKLTYEKFGPPAPLLIKKIKIKKQRKIKHMTHLTQDNPFNILKNFLLNRT